MKLRKPAKLLLPSVKHPDIAKADDDIAYTIGLNCPTAWRSTAPPDEVSERINKIFYETIRKWYGTCKPKHVGIPKRKWRKPRRLLEIRKKKNRMRKILKALKKQGDSSIYRRKRAEYSKLHRLHILLRKRWALLHTQRETIDQQKRFNKDHFKFVSEVFQQKSRPNVQCEETEAYF